MESISDLGLIFLAGIAAGFVNTVAGGGSALTIPILVELVGASTANGTNRIAVLAESLASTISFERGGALDWSWVKQLVVPVVTGAIIGSWAATELPQDVLQSTFGVVLAGVAASVLIKPSAWTTGGRPRLSQPWRWVVFFGIGLYGGLVQVGVGFLMLGGLVVGCGLDAVSGNAVKVALIGLYTVGSLILFASASQVNVKLGLILAAGNAIGATISSRLAIRRGAGWIRWFIFMAVIAAAIRLVVT